MANRLYLTPTFYSKAKRLLKKYQTLQSSLDKLEQQLLANTKTGVSYGANIYKIRISDESKGKGKSGGFRVITYLIEPGIESFDIYLITIFDKSEESSITKASIQKLIKSEGL